MYPLNNQLVLNYFKLVFIKTKLESHFRHSKSSTKSQNSTMFSATLAHFQVSSWSVGVHGFKIKINLKNHKAIEIECWSSKVQFLTLLPHKFVQVSLICVIRIRPESGILRCKALESH